MEAKDTVMSYVQAKKIILNGHCSPETRLSDIAITGIEQDFLNAQAEISFKAGQQEGMKEVVEFLNKHRQGITTYGVYIPDDEWEAKLKEWGIG